MKAVSAMSAQFQSHQIARACHYGWDSSQLHAYVSVSLLLIHSTANLRELTSDPLTVLLCEQSVCRVNLPKTCCCWKYKSICLNLPMPQWEVGENEKKNYGYK